MHRKIETKTRGELVIEHVVWNAAAGAALAVMILVLLCSLQWLDGVTPSAAKVTAPAAPLEGPAATEVAAVNHPSG